MAINMYKSGSNSETATINTTKYIHKSLACCALSRKAIISNQHNFQKYNMYSIFATPVNARRSGNFETPAIMAVKMHKANGKQKQI